MRTFANEMEGWLAHLCLMNVNTTSIDTLYTDCKQRIAMGIRIDISPIDGMPASEEQRHRMLRKSRFIAGIVRNKCMRDAWNSLDKLRHLAGQVLYYLIGRKRLFAWRENIFRRVDFEKEGIGATMPANHGFAPHSWRKAEWFSDYRDVPFEYLIVKVPLGAEQQLDQLYGKDWRTPKRHAGFHNDMLIDAHRGYKDVLVEKFGYEMDWLKDLP
jgi:phosphorylcholine metabolism protein LicD